MEVISYEEEETEASSLCSAVQDMMNGAELTLQPWCQPLAAVTGSATEAALCWVEQTCKNYAAAAAAAAAGNVPDLCQMETWAVDSVHEACCISLYLAVALGTWKTFFQGNAAVGMGWWRTDTAC